MSWLSAPDDWLTRLVLQRAVGLVYLIAFLVTLDQFLPLLGERGLLPVPAFVRAVPFRRAPSIFHLHYSDRMLLAVAWTGIAGSVAVLLGLPEAAPTWVSMLVWFVLWALYLSIVNVGQTFYGFGWETLLTEAGFLAILLGSAGSAPPVLVIWLFRWLVIRVELGAGLIKLRGDPCWRNLSCLDYHHETQPMPNPLSWHFHHLPRPLHRVEVLGNHVAQLVAPIGLLLPQPVAGICGLVMVATQLWLVLSGNFSWLNLLTIALATSAFDGAWLHRVIPVSPPPGLSPTPTWHLALALALTALVAALSWWPVRNMASRRQFMNTSFNALRLVNSYGAFGSVTRVRNEVVLEGTDATEPGPETEWREYEFKGKPGDVRRRPPQVAPYHLRLDWLMWFAALRPGYADRWLVQLVRRLLVNDPASLRLLRHNPFPDRPPAMLRARLYRYRFTSRAERRATGAWWHRELVGEYLPAMMRSLGQASVERPAGRALCFDRPGVRTGGRRAER
jgi:Lipase maturation factor